MRTDGIAYCTSTVQNSIKVTKFITKTRKVVQTKKSRKPSKKNGEPKTMTKNQRREKTKFLNVEKGIIKFPKMILFLPTK